MSKHRFKYYLHDDYQHGEMVEELTRQGLPTPIAEQIAENRPFYEVTFACEYDDVTGRTTMQVVP